MKNKSAFRRHRIQRSYRFETLEDRHVLASDFLGGVSGVVALDSNSSGTFDAGEEVVAAEVQLYLDQDGDGAFDGALDTLVGTRSTNEFGAYSFEGLATGDYFVVQPTQVASGLSLGMRVSALTSVNGNGATAQALDDLQVASTEIEAVSNPGATASSVTDDPTLLGGQRDLNATLVEVTNSSDFERVRMSVVGQSVVIDPSNFAVGEYSLEWDGMDTAGAGVNATGLGGLNLVSGSSPTTTAHGICIHDVNPDKDGVTVRLRVYTDANRFSEVVFDNLTADQDQDLYASFADAGNGEAFFAAAGVMGGADFMNVGAVTIDVITTLDGTDFTMGAIESSRTDFANVDVLNTNQVPLVDIQVLTNGAQADNPDDADVPVLQAGAAIVWTYEVTNNGVVEIDQVTVVDDQLGGITNIIDQGDGDNVLDPDETWIYEVTGTALDASYMNTATVTVDSVFGMASDSDTSNYRGGTSLIDIETFTNGAQADNIGDDDVPQLTEGADVAWTYRVTNNGTFSLTDVVVQDDQLGQITTIVTNGNGDDVLDPGESWDFTAMGIATVGNYANVGSVSAVGEDSLSVSDMDSSHYIGQPLVVNPTVALLVNGQSGNVEVGIGSLVDKLFTVTNDTSATIRNVRVTNDNGTPTDTTDDFFAQLVGGDTDGDDQLDPGEVWRFQSFADAVEGTSTCGLTMEGTTNGGSVTGSAQASYTGVLDRGNSGWHNGQLPGDINEDGVVSANDAIIMINEILLRSVSDPITNELDPPPPTRLYDVNDDGLATTQDLVILINDISTPPALDLNGSESGTGVDVVFPFRATSVFLLDERFEFTNEGGSPIDSALVQVSEFFGAGESLAADSVGNISISTLADGSLQLSGTDSVNNYIRALRSVRYVSTTPGGVHGAIVFDFSVTSNDRTSEPATATVTRETVAPFVDLNGDDVGTDGFVELPFDATSLGLFGSNLTVQLGSASGVSSATVSIVGFVAGEESLSFDATGTSINGVFNDQTGVLTLTGSDTLGNYQTVLRSIALDLATAGGTRTPILIDVAVGDGTVTGEPARLTVNRELVPATLDLNGDDEGNDVAVSLLANQTSTTLLDDRLTIDPGSTTSLDSATFTIVDFVAGQELLTIDTSGSAIFASFNAVTGVLTLSGGDTFDNYRSVMQTVTFEAMTAGTTRDPLLVEIVVGSGTAVSQPATVTINRGEVAWNLDLDNTADGTGVIVSYPTGEALTTILDERLTLSDGTIPSLVSATLQIQDFTAGDETELIVEDGTLGTDISASFSSITGTLTLAGTDSLENYLTVLRSILFRTVSAEDTTLITVVVNDGTSESNVAEIQAQRVAAVVDLNGMSAGTDVTFDLVDPMTVSVFAELTIDSEDTTEFDSATVAIEGYVAGEESLVFNPAGPFTGAFNSTTGVLDIAGTASVADYATMLSQIELSLTTPGGVRTPMRVTVSVANDGEDSNSATAIVNTEANVAPVLSTISDVTLLSGSPLHIPLVATDANGDSLSFAATSSNAEITTFIPAGNHSLRMNVSSPTDPNFVGGDMVFELFEGRAPRATERIIELSNQGFYDGLIFHRVVSSFVIQSGDPTGIGTGGSELDDFDDQYHPDLQHNRTGVLSMAKSLDDTNNSQFFVTDRPTRNLDFSHTVFGQLITGEEVRAEIQNVQVDRNDRPIEDIVINEVEVFVDDKNGVLMLSAPEGYTGTATITVSVMDSNGATMQQMFNVTVMPDTINNQPYLEDIPVFMMSPDSTSSFQLSAIDLEGDDLVFLDQDQLIGGELLVENTSPDVSYFVDPTSGEVTVVASNGFTGTVLITVGVLEVDMLQVPGRAIDLQVVEIQVGQL